MLPGWLSRFRTGDFNDPGMEFLRGVEFSDTLCTSYLGRQTETKGNIEMAICIRGKRCTGRMDRPKGGIIEIFFFWAVDEIEIFSVACHV